MRLYSLSARELWYLGLFIVRVFMTSNTIFWFFQKVHSVWSLFDGCSVWVLGSLWLSLRIIDCNKSAVYVSFGYCTQNGPENQTLGIALLCVVLLRKTDVDVH